jgi:LPXTG-motif cell wall-anchored protein
MSCLLVSVPLDPTSGWQEHSPTRTPSPSSRPELWTALPDVDRGDYRALQTRIVLEATLMNRSRTLGLAGLGVFTAVAILSAPADAATATFTASPRSGPPGTTITVASVTKCVLPAGVTGQPFIRISLARGTTVVATTDIPTSPSGSWTGTLAVGSMAAPGVDTIEAFCIAGPQAEGAVLAYEPVSFTVTPAGSLPNTGVHLRAVGIAGAVVLMAGLGLLVVTRRPLDQPDQPA